MDSRQDEDLEKEKRWVEAAREDVSNFRPLYEKYNDPVFRFFVRRTDDVQLAEELCSNTFYKVLDNLAAYQWQGKPFGAWLFRIAGNELRKHFRDKRPVYVLEEEKLDCLMEVEEDVADYLPSLVQVLDRLEEAELRLLELKFFEGLNFKEISELMDIGESAAKMRLYRLLHKLKLEIKGKP